MGWMAVEAHAQEPATAKAQTGEVAAPEAVAQAAETRHTPMR